MRKFEFELSEEDVTILENIINNDICNSMHQITKLMGDTTTDDSVTNSYIESYESLIEQTKALKKKIFVEKEIPSYMNKNEQYSEFFKSEKFTSLIMTLSNYSFIDDNVIRDNPEKYDISSEDFLMVCKTVFSNLRDDIVSYTDHFLTEKVSYCGMVFSVMYGQGSYFWVDKEV